MRYALTIAALGLSLFGCNAERKDEKMTNSPAKIKVEDSEMRVEDPAPISRPGNEKGGVDLKPSNEKGGVE
jgi:hypothetical protein